MFSENPSKRHPISSDEFRHFLSSTPLLWLVLLYIVINIFISLILGTFYNLGSNSSVDMNFYDWWFYSLIQLLNVDPPPSFSFELTTIQTLVFIVNAIFGLLLPTMLLGSIVFKITTNSRIIIFRKKIAINCNEDGKYELSIRYYNSSKLSLFNPVVSVFLRHVISHGEGHTARGNVKLNEREPAFMSYQNPQKITVSLYDEDIALSEGQPMLRSIQGHKLPLGSLLTIFVKGVMPNLQLDLIVSYTYHPLEGS